MIDLDAEGPVYRGHKLARIVEMFAESQEWGTVGYFPSYLSQPTSTKGWAMLDVRVRGNVWGLSVSDLPEDYIRARHCRCPCGPSHHRA